MNYNFDLKNVLKSLIALVFKDGFGLLQP
jgi:hypothetical protein